jgi:hypothetical protein
MRRFAVVFVAVLGVLAVPLALPALAPVAIAAPVAPDPAVGAIAIPSAFVGTQTVIDCAAPPAWFACAPVAGVAAFVGTCQIAGSLQHLWGGDASCTNGLKRIGSFVTNLFGGGGDNRTVVVANSSVDPAKYEGYVKTYQGFSYTPDPAPGIQSAAWVLGSQYVGSQLHFDQEFRCLNLGTGAVRAYMFITNGTWNTGAGTWGYSSNNAPRCGPNSPGYTTGNEELVQASTYVPTGSGTKVANWYYDVAPNTPWTLTYTETCMAPGGATATASVTSNFTPAPNTKPPDVQLPGCTEILGNSHVDKLQITGGRNGVTEYNIVKNTFTAAAIASYPLCTGNAPAGGCYTDLKKNGVSCYAAGAYCANWTDPANIGSYTCNWGPYPLAISVCQTDLSTAFETQVQPNPNPSPTVSAGGAGFPSAGSNTDPKTGTTSTGSGGPAPDPLDVMGNCLGSFWSWNPTNWVYTPVKCVLQWALVPNSAQMQTLTQSVQSNFGGTKVAQWWDSIGNVLAPIGGTANSSCDGIDVRLNWVPGIDQTLHLLRACEDPMRKVAQLSYDFTSFIVVVMGGIAGLRGLSMGFGFELGFADRVKMRSWEGK